MTDPAPRRRRSAAVLPWLIAVLVGLLVFAATFAILQGRHAHSLSGQISTRNAAAQTASDVGAALFTYDYRDLSATQARLRSLATGGFLQQQQMHFQTISRRLTAAHASSTARVEQVSVSDVIGNKASALVVVQTRATTTEGATSGTDYLHMTLQYVDSRWKVSAVQTLSPATG